MEENIQKYITKYSGSFKNWVDSLNRFSGLTFAEENIAEDESDQIIFNAARVFADLLKIFIDFGKFKDTWEPPEFSLNPFSLHTEIKSVKTGQIFELGLDERSGFYLQIYLTNSANLRNMSDDFWRSFLELSDLGEFEFIENAGFSKEETRDHRELFRSFKGNLFRLMRNYFFGEIKYGESIDLGWLSIKWSLSTDIEDFFASGCQAFKILYMLNYDLWKIGDLRKKENKI